MAKKEDAAKRLTKAGKLGKNANRVEDETDKNTSANNSESQPKISKEKAEHPERDRPIH